jgi:erythromycin esterase
MKLLWKIKLDNKPRQKHNLFPPLIAGSVTTAAGEKEIAVVAGVSDNTYGIDVARGTLPGSDSEISLPAQTSSDRAQFRASVAAALIITACGTRPAVQGLDAQKIVDWASSHASPISEEALREVGRSADGVAVGESAHGGEEALAFRNQMFRTLAERNGFRAIALETGYAESRRIDDFIAGGPGDAADVALRYLTSGFGNFQANVDLIEWMRTYNRGRDAARRLRFYGIDLSLGGPLGSSATAAPIECALTLLEREIPSEARPLRQAFSKDVERLLNEQRPFTTPELDRYDNFVRSLLALARTSGHLEAIQCATIAQQAGQVQRLSPRPRPGGGIPPDAWRTLEARDMAMADNAMWAQDQLGPNGKLVVFAHNAHVMNAPQRGGHLSGLAQPPRTMGQRLRERLGTKLVIVAEAAPGQSTSSPRDFGDLLRTAARPPFVLDLRGIPADLRPWINQPRSLRANGDSETFVSPATAFDVVVVQQQHSPARPNSRSSAGHGR